MINVSHRHSIRNKSRMCWLEITMKLELEEVKHQLRPQGHSVSDGNLSEPASPTPQARADPSGVFSLGAISIS